jgi:mono/diheme cytochrome c family protein
VRARGCILLIALLALGGCERGLHQMYDQPKYSPLAPSTLFADGSSSRPQVAGTVAHEPAAAPPAITPRLLARGRERYGIYCAPCHGESGDGAGMIVQRGFPAPPSYHDERLRDAPDSHFYAVISDGYGAMYGYADRIAPADRWAIVAYVRALQLSQHAPAALLDASDLRRLGAQR